MKYGQTLFCASDASVQRKEAYFFLGLYFFVIIS